MTNADVLRIAMEQSARDLGCGAEDFLRDGALVVPLRLGADAKKYYRLPIGANLVSYGNNVVAAADGACLPVIREYVGRFESFHCFETPAMRWLNERLEPMGQTVCFMAEYYLPDLRLLGERACPFETRVLEPADFAGLYLPEWANALCAERKELDVLAVGAYDGPKLVGLAGCSADAEAMWQIGVDVLPEYRRRGVASAVTSRLALEILRRGKVPFYCSAWSNIRSARNAIKCWILPAWAEMTVKPIATVREMNGETAG